MLFKHFKLRHRNKKLNFKSSITENTISINRAQSYCNTTKATTRAYIAYILESEDEKVQKIDRNGRKL